MSRWCFALLIVACGATRGGAPVSVAHVERSASCPAIVCPADTWPRAGLSVWRHEVDWRVVEETSVPGFEPVSLPDETEVGPARWCERTTAPHLRHGPARFCDAHGRLRVVGNYDDGVPSGVWIQIDEHGVETRHSFRPSARVERSHRAGTAPSRRSASR